MFCVQYMIVLWGFPLLLPIRVQRDTMAAMKCVHACLYCAADPHHLLSHRLRHHALPQNLHVKEAGYSDAHAEENGASFFL